MPRFTIVKDPMRPLKDAEFFNYPDTTVRGFLAKHEVDMAGRLCLVDSKQIPEADWDRKLNEKAIVVVCPSVGLNFAVLLLVAIIIAVAVYFLISVPPASTTGEPEADPVYTLRGQKNQTRLSEPVEMHYGRTRHWPSYMARPYNQFYNNDQYLFALLCVGLGYYDIEAIQVEDTAIGEFQDITYEIYQPGELVTLFPTNVQTSTEVGGIELYGPNEEDYEGWSGPFTAASPGSRAYTLEIDLACRQGLYRLNEEGKARNTTVSVEAEYRLIDDDGEPLGDWTALTSFTRSDDTNKPQRFTLSATVAAGRYEVRVRRTNDKSDSFRIRHAIHWESLRAFCETEQNFGNVTLLAIKARATDNLNDSSRNGFNVITTAKVPIYDGGTGLWTRTATRNPVWAALDVLRAKYGRRLPARLIDLEAFTELAADLEAEEIWFDGTFDQRGTVWTTLQNILAVANAVPVVPAGLLSVVRDKPQTVPTLGFNGNNIGRDSVTVNTKLFKYADHDGIEVEYIDGATWKRRTVLCLIGTDRGINPRQLKLIGCTDRNRAYRWGMYQRATELYQTDNIVFETGLEGGTAVYGDLIAVKHELIPAAAVFEAEQSGRLAFGAFGTKVVGEDTVTTITLPVAPTFEFGEVHRISVRDKFGVIRGPYICTEDETDPAKVVLEVELDTEDIIVAADAEQPLFWFGVSGREYTLCKIIKLESPEPHKIRVTAIPYDERIYAYADAIAPPIDYYFNVPADPSAPVVTGLTVEPYPGSLDQYVASWSPAVGAKFYVVSKSLDGVNYTRLDETVVSNYLFTAEPGTDLWVSVYAVGAMPGPATVWTSEGVIGGPEGPPEDTDPPYFTASFDGNALQLLSPVIDLAVTYKWRVYVFDAVEDEFVVLSTYVTDKPAFTYTSAAASSAASTAGKPLTRTFRFTVAGINTAGEGVESSPVEATNAPPSAPSGLFLEFLGTTEVTTGGTILYLNNNFRLSWNPSDDLDFYCFHIFANATDGFTPDPTPGTGNRVNAPGTYTEATMGMPENYASQYAVIGAQDRWGEEVIYSAQIPIICKTATALATGAPTGTDYPVSWSHGSESFLQECNVYASTVAGFTPGPANLVDTVAAPGNTAILDGTVRPLYWRVGVVDSRGPAEKFSAEAVIP